MPILTLHGCSPEPLGNYLKALGVFRLVAEQADPAPRAWWEAGAFRLSSAKFKTAEDLCVSLHKSCAYSAFVSPWLAKPASVHRIGRNRDAVVAGLRRHSEFPFDAKIAGWARKCPTPLPIILREIRFLRA